MRQLTCKVEIEYGVSHANTSPDNWNWSVYDGDIVVMAGTSSNDYWTRSDVSERGKKRLDELYPDGWEMTFDF